MVRFDMVGCCVVRYGHKNKMGSGLVLFGTDRVGFGVVRYGMAK